MLRVIFNCMKKIKHVMTCFIWFYNWYRVVQYQYQILTMVQPRSLLMKDFQVTPLPSYKLPSLKNDMNFKSHV